MNTQPINFRLMITALVAVTIAACGGGGGGNGAPAQPTPPPPTGGGSILITGMATKGPMDSSNVALIPIDSFGQVAGPAIVNTTTNANGSFTASIPAGTGPLLVRAGGGSYVDEADQEPDPALRRRIFLANDEGLESLLPAGVTTITVSVVTQALLDKTRRESTGNDFLQVFEANRAIAVSAFGFDVITTTPANPVSPAATATVAQRQYAMVLGGLANLINRITIDAGYPEPTIETILSTSDDLSDGRIDGLIAGAPVMVACVAIDTYSLNNEIARFRNNNFDAYASTPLIAVNENIFSQSSNINLAPVATADSYVLDAGTT